VVFFYRTPFYNKMDALTAKHNAMRD